MRWLCICVALAACATITSAPGDDDGSGGGSGSGSGSSKAEVCRDARDCSPDDYACETYPYEQLPPRCYDICQRHYCCDYFDSAWHLRVYDCAFPSYDAGIDAP